MVVNKQKIKILLSSLIPAVILLSALLGGLSSGRTLAQAASGKTQAENLKTALNYFYQDQNRYPTELEFATPSVMLNYLTAMPLGSLAVSQCPEAVNYKRLTPSSFSLNFCLPAAAGSYQKGWNALSGQLGS